MLQIPECQIFALREVYPIISLFLLRQMYRKYDYFSFGIVFEILICETIAFAFPMFQEAQVRVQCDTVSVKRFAQRIARAHYTVILLSPGTNVIITRPLVVPGRHSPLALLIRNHGLQNVSC